MASGKIRMLSGFADTHRIESGMDLDDLTTPGAYSCINATIAVTLTNSPVTNVGFVMEVFSKGSNVTQVIWLGSSIYTRSKFSSGFESWFKYQGTAVS